jgi:hypothetical protein
VNVIDNSHMEQIVNYVEAQSGVISLHLVKKLNNSWFMTIVDTDQRVVFEEAGTNFSMVLKKMSELIYASTQE